MFHLSVFQLASPATAAFSLSDMPAVADPSVTLTQTGHIVFEMDIQLELAYAFGQTDITAAQFQTPRLRPIALPSIRPLDVAVLPSTRLPISRFTRNPLKLNKIDENSMQISGSVGTIANKYYAGAWFGDGNKSKSQGQQYAVFFTAAIVAVANAWTAGVIALNTTLPAGKYAVVGMDIFGTNLAFARLVFPRQQWRPGVVAGQNAAFINAPCFRDGDLGDFGTFESYAQPQLDIFAVGANSAQTGILDLVKIG